MKNKKQEIVTAYVIFIFVILVGVNLPASDYRIGGNVSERDREDVESLVNDAESLYLSKFKLDSNFALNIYVCKDGEEFSRLTGAHGWNGGHFNGRTIYLQRIEALRQRGILEQTVTHEFLHFCIGRIAGRNCPVWLNEGLVLNLSGEVPALDCSCENPTEPPDGKKIETDIGSTNRARSKEGYCTAAKLTQKLIAALGFEKIRECLVYLKTGNKQPLDLLIHFHLR